MKCLKVDEFIKRTASVKETELLLQELEMMKHLHIECPNLRRESQIIGDPFRLDYVKSPTGLHGRTLCDRVIRACNHQLGVGSPDLDHINQLVKLVELSLHGYDVSGACAAQSSPLYMEKILFHIVKKLRSLGVHDLCRHLAGELYNRLTQVQQVEDYCVLVRSCFSVLWNGLASVKDGTKLNPRDKLHCKLQALAFLLLLDTETASTPSYSKVLVYTEDALAEFENSCGTVTKEDGSFLLQTVLTLFSSCWTGGQGCEGDSKSQSIKLSSSHVLSEVVLILVKLLCKAGFYELASTLLDEINSRVRPHNDCQGTALVLGKWAVKVCATKSAGQESGQAFTECARALRSLSADLGDREAHAILEGCNLVVLAAESGHSKGLSGPVLLAWFSFLEEHQELISKILQKKLTSETERSRLQHSLCFSMYQGFVFAYDSMLASQLENGETLDRVLLYCQASAGQMMTELRKQPSENFFIKAVIAVSNLASWLYNQKLYDQAFTLAEILCRELCKNPSFSLSVERLSRPFMLAVQSSRRVGQLERALDWVILWLKALGDNITAHMAEPVTLWVKTKTDAFRTGEEDVRLRTLRDGFGPDVPDEKVILSLLEEELRAYKEVAGDTAQERYNTLCDLLDICHEESPHTHLRAVYLYEMAQVVCFQDFSEQTDCTAVDFTNEALRLLEEIPETAENADRLKDDKAHALLWLYICTLEKNLQETIDKDKKLQELRQQTKCVATPTGTNDFDYEDKQKSQDSVHVYEGLLFNLAGESKLCQPLERALDEWSVLLQTRSVPTVRNPKQTCISIVVTAALFKLIGKPLKALEAYQCAFGFSRHLGDGQGSASSLCQSAKILLEMGAPELALAQLEQAEKFLISHTTPEGPSSLSMLAILLKAQYCYSTGQVDRGVPYLCEVLKEVNEQRQSKSWYLLRARVLQTCSSYLSLDTAALSQAQRCRITQYGVNSTDTALYESLKLLCSLLVTLVGKGLYGTHSVGSDVRFVDQGDNLVLKWQILSELLQCSLKMVALRSSCGAIHDARLQCLEALKLAIKLQALSQCAELLVVKAELELMQGEREESGFDLDKVRNILELCTDFSDPEHKAEVKIKPRKGRPAQKAQSPLVTTEDEFKDILSTRWHPKEPMERDQACSPPLKAQPRRWLSSLAHKLDCHCPCCSEPCLGRVTARWAATQADLALQLGPAEAKVSLKLHRATLTRCKSVTNKLALKLAKLFPLCGPTKGSAKPTLMQDVVGRVYLRMALSGLEPRFDKIHGIWNVLEAGLAFVNSMPSPVLRPLRAGLMATKAMLCLVTLATKKGCTPEELFANAWTWNAPKEGIEQKSEQKMVPPSALKKSKASAGTDKNPEVSIKTKEAKKVKAVRPKIQVTSSTSKGKSKAPITPVMGKTKPSVKELGSFEFNTVVPSLTVTPVQKVKAPVSAQKGTSKAVSKLQFHVYEDLSPVQDRAQRVPAAPRRTKKSLFKVEFSDESDSELELKEKMDVPKKRTTTRRTAPKLKTLSEPPAERVPKRQAKGKKSTALIQSTCSEDETVVCPPASARRGRTRRKLSGTETEIVEEPDKMRTIEEKIDEKLDISIEQLRTSDTETEDNAASNIDFEVLRRDKCCSLERDDLSELRSRGELTESLQTHLSHSDSRPEDLSLDAIQSLLRSSWLGLHHFPPPALYPTLCSLLALTLGQQDPITTAMLHAQSLGVTNRHRMIRHLTSCLKKLRKTSGELADSMDALRLDELSPAESKGPTEQSLSKLENVFSFPTSDPSTFPKHNCQEFMQQIQHLPSGVTVCMMSLLGVKPGQMGDSIILSRLEKGSAPVTVHIPTSKQQHPVSWLVQEMDNIQVEQKVVSCVSDKAKWWEGRRALDSRVERLLEEMEGLLGCWKSFLLPQSSDPELNHQAQHLHKALSARGVMASEEMLKAVLSASPVLSQPELKRFALGLDPQWAMECDQLFHTALSQLADRDEPNGHVVLILDKYLQKLPWESVSILKSHSVSRMPSLHSLIGLSLQKETDTRSILKQGVDTKQVFYVLDPDANLGNSQDQFKEFFCNKQGWEGVCGVAPDSGQLEEAVATKDLYIYVGHGAGARFLDSQTMLKRQMRAASLLFGCSSAALAVRGDLEGQGIVLNYLMAGCPFVLGNLWDVTDRDIDRFTKALLESWFSAGSGAPLLDHMGPSRQATHLKHLIGAAPVVYGLPIHLQ